MNVEGRCDVKVTYFISATGLLKVLSTLCKVQSGMILMFVVIHLQMAHIPKWKVIYATDVDDLCDMDYDQRILIPNQDNTYFMTDVGQT